MKIIITFYLITGLVSSTDVIGYSGGSLIMVSFQSLNQLKYFCKLAEDGCKKEMYFSAQADTVNEGSFSLYENTQEYFTMLLRKLNPRDAGIYRFAWENWWPQEIKLQVHEDDCCVKSVTMTGHLNKEISISCDYTKEHKGKRKYLYKLKGHSLDVVIYTSPGGNYKKNYFYITDDQHLNLITVNIRDLKEEDGGVYFCGTQTWAYPTVLISTIKTVHLQVTDKFPSSVRVTGFLGGRVMMKCRHPLEKPKARFLCREMEGECTEKTYTNVQNEWQQNGGFSLYDDTSGESLMVFFRNLSEGTYRCGVDVSEFTEQYTEVKVEVKEDPCCVKIISQAGYIDETLTISCEHPPILRANLKHFCKEDEKLICQDIRAAGKYSLSDHSQPGLFTVTISNLTLSDAGVYWCGVETREWNISHTSLTTKVQISIISSKVIGSEGDAVEIRCPYDSKYKQNSKHVCKDECFTEHSDSLTAQQSTQNKTERFSVHDDITAGVFSVNISRVTAEDAGRYWCGVETGDVLMNYLSTELQVVRKESVLQVFGQETLSVSIKCSYRGESTESDGKFLCMGQQLSSCEKGGVKVSSEKNRTGRFSLSDDAPAGVFTVTITDLREEDSGTYWCGEESFGSTIYTEVHLHVSKGPVPSVIITVCVCVVLLLIGGSTLIYYKLKHKKTQDLVNLICSQVSPAACDYEEINHSGQHPDTNVYMNTSSSTDRSDKNKAISMAKPQELLEANASQ
ncbi:polymeric immunoglobulin receptor-like [Colossoma macropomum]|uniref:polymeric immunoglobulin receptor-like n=1 Tax=Colossoma macropomum TaxID=42526 RepID=UPI0018641C10|nr:polymeric immunoglobulin receptor-like [Colossoma macropomum]